MRLIDADAIFNGELLLVSDKAYDAVHAVIERINNAPTVDAVPLEDYKSMERTVNKLTKAIADAVEVVRCKDCYYCATEKSFGKEYLYCDAFYEHAEGDLIGVSLMVEPNHFCAWGERRKDGNEPKPV